MTILEGESLLNDATALVTLRTAIAAFSGGFAMIEVGVDFVRAAGGGAARSASASSCSSRGSASGSPTR